MRIAARLLMRLKIRLAAFELALAQNADGIELDVKLVADGQVVVIHDPTVNTYNGAHGRVKDLSLERVAIFGCR